MQRMILGFSLAVLAAACGFDSDSQPDDGPLGGALTVTGDVVDFETGAAITGTATVATSGLVGAPVVTTQGAAFTIAGIPENSAFQVLAGALPTHRSTFSSTVIVKTEDLDGIKIPAVSEVFLAQLATSFGVTPTAAKGVLFVRAVDGAGMPKANVAAATFVLGGGAIGPKFVDANLAPLPNATATTASGWAVFFEVLPGVVALGPTAATTVDMAISPINAGVVTLADATVTAGAQVLPTNVSFKNTVFPIFSGRGCIACHAGGGPGKGLGGLDLGSLNKAYRELVEERPNTRVKLATPELSLVLTYPSREDPPDRHPNITFASAADPDFLKILVWIREGATNN